MPYLKRKPNNPEPIDCRILTAALDLFVANGYHKVSVHEIQKLADVSIGSIYNHFGGKDGIAKALYEHIVNEIDELVDGISNEFDSPLIRIKEIIRQLFNHTESHSNIIAFAFYAKHSEFLKEDNVISKTLPFIKIRTIVEAAMEQGELKKIDIDVVMSMIFGGMTRMIQLRLDKVIEAPLSEYYSQFIDSTLGGLQERTNVDHKTVIAAVS